MDEKWFIRIEDKIDLISDKISAQHEVLKDHTKRTDDLEKKSDEIQERVHHVEGAAKLVGFLGVIIGIAAGLFEILR